MPKTRAVCALTADQVVLREVTIPDPEPQEVVVRAEYSSISTGTERWVITGQFHPPGGKPMPYPLVPGYQKVGVVEALGAEVTGLHIGQRVFATTAKLADEEVIAGWGGHIEHSVLPQSEVIPLPEGLDPVKAAALVLTQVGYNGGSRPPVRQGDKALVIGDGLVGQWLAQMLRHRGARVVLVGRRPERLATAVQWSVELAVDVRQTPLAEVAQQEAPGGFDIVADSIGTAESVAQVLGLVRRDGHLVLNGYYREGEHLLSIQQLHSREITAHAPAGWTRQRLEATLGLVEQGALRVRELMTHIMPVEKASEAYQLVLHKPEAFLGVCLDWRNL
ncbi:MAG: zinc-binding alcohol dehydrogenase [Candidatus Latescibacteria bacterium]|nr:zinc-binding alcohol dehydrogenase [Candidatus Latescibacterota bacterium]